jgi:hypothetical protein
MWFNEENKVSEPLESAELDEGTELHGESRDETEVEDGH